MRYAIFEILDMADKAKKKEEKINILRQYYSTALTTVLKYALDPTIKWALPAGVPPYEPSKMEERSYLYSEARRLYLFIEGGNPNLKPARREMLFIEMIQNAHPEDAKILIAAKDKKLPYKSINKKLVNEAFPGLLTLPNEEKDEQDEKV